MCANIMACNLYVNKKAVFQKTVFIDKTLMFGEGGSGNVISVYRYEHERIYN